MSVCWVMVTESEEEGIETVRIEQPVDYVRERPAKLKPLGIIFSAIGWIGFFYLIGCVVLRVAR